MYKLTVTNQNGNVWERETDNSAEAIASYHEAKRLAPWPRAITLYRVSGTALFRMGDWRRLDGTCEVSEVWTPTA